MLLPRATRITGPVMAWPGCPGAVAGDGIPDAALPLAATGGRPGTVLR